MMNFFKNRLNKKGFTLVELLIVIAVLGIIAGIGVTSMSGVTTTFKNKADAETARQLSRQIEIQVLAGTITLAGGESGDTFTKKKPPTGITFPETQSGGDFEITVAKDGTITAKAGTTVLEMNGYKIQTSKVE